MRIDQAKAIPLERVLAVLGHAPTHHKGQDVWYLSPFREENTASFKCNTAWNSWYDFGLGKGGNILDFVMVYFQLGTVSDALAKLDTLVGIQGSDTPLPLFPTAPLTVASPPAPSAPASPPSPPPTVSSIALKKVQPLQNHALVQYLGKRAIPARVARPFVQEAYYTVAGKDRTYFALAFPNRSGGMELRYPYFQGVLGAKDISLLFPDEKVADTLLVFEGFLDFLSVLAHQHRQSLPAPVLVLNSVSMKDTAIATIREQGISRVRLYLDRDSAGRALTAAFQTLEGLTVVDESRIYEGYKDFNDFLITHAAHHTPEERMM